MPIGSPSCSTRNSSTGGAPDLCLILDANVAWMKKPLRRRGFIVYAPHDDYPCDASDAEIYEWAEKLGCIVVSMDIFFRHKTRAVYVPHTWLRRYNSWDLVTKVIKLASKLRRG